MSAYGLPARTGRYPLLRNDGRVVMVRVIRMNGDLYAVHGWLGLLATPVDLMPGTWLVPGEARV